ncbi:hypothetical protein PWT90_05127 [Aphanocladium album]|nr:hypothetical protein PWT90_05127 [Aphanocladium album]
MPLLNQISLRLKDYLCKYARNAPPPNLILELPVDILRIVADYLSPRDLLVLSRTCRAFHSIVHPRLLRRAPAASAEEMLEFLYLLASENPGRWACQSCLTLHQVDHNDHPIRHAGSSSSCAVAAAHQFVLNNGQYVQHHHHLQLALKLYRLPDLTEEQDAYLGHLLRGHISLFTIGQFSVRRERTHRIVKGRYLRKTEARVTADEDDASVTPNDAIHLVPECCPKLDRNIMSNTSGIVDSVIWAHITPTMPYIFVCPHCAAEFQVCLDQRAKAFHLLTWQNLGTEGALTNLHWTYLTTGQDQENIGTAVVELNQEESERPRKLWGDKRPRFYDMISLSDIED